VSASTASTSIAESSLLEAPYVISVAALLASTSTAVEVSA
jgi:hypothetical protein